jgi:hypothetical protein
MLLAFFFSLGAQGFAGLESGHPEQALDLASIKAHHRLPVNDGDRRRPETLLQKFLECRLICPDVLVQERDPLARKKLFLLVARPSAGLRVHNDLLRHGFLPATACCCRHPLSLHHFTGDGDEFCLPI